MQLFRSKATVLILSILTSQLVAAVAVPEPAAEIDILASDLEKRTTCWMNYLPSCCRLVTWYSYPSTKPGPSQGCVTMASQPGGVCPTTGASTRACCKQSPNVLYSGRLDYQPDGSVYCYGGV